VFIIESYFASKLFAALKFSNTHPDKEEPNKTAIHANWLQNLGTQEE
jgi:hypothetical protein